MPKQSMPRSCGLTLRTLRKKAGCTVEQWRQRLEAHILPRYRGKAKFDDGVIGKAEHSEQALYWLLDGYAKLTGYPTGLIYLISRLSADLRDGNIEDVKNITAALRALVDYLDEDSCARLVDLPDPDMDARDSNSGDCLTAYETIMDYKRKPLPSDHPEAGKPYNKSGQRLEDAKQVLIVLDLLQHVVPPCPSPVLSET